MYHKIRITVVSLIVMTLCVLSSVATLSYFTDTDVATNTFVVGNASTKLMIYDDVSTAGNYQVLDASDEKYNLVPGLDIPFYLEATNDGNIPVYQRFRVVIPIALRSVIMLDLPDCAIDTTIEAGVSECSNVDYTVTYNPAVLVGETPTYAEYYIVSNLPVAKNGKTKEWPTSMIKIGEITDEQKSLFVCPVSDSSDNNCTLGISAYSDAIQTTGFDNATEAFQSLTVETY